VTLDNEKDLVAGETIRFFRDRVAKAAKADRILDNVANHSAVAA
jgi:hypothetical protein